MTQPAQEILRVSRWIGGMNAGLLLLALGFGALALSTWSVKTGRAYLRGAPIYRDDSPFYFWFSVAMWVLIAFMFLGAGVLPLLR